MSLNKYERDERGTVNARLKEYAQQVTQEDSSPDNLLPTAENIRKRPKRPEYAQRVRTRRNYINVLEETAKRKRIFP